MSHALNAAAVEQLPEPVATPFDHCSTCESKNLELIFEMPNFPQIGIYLDDPSMADRFPPVDQGLTVCADCGHVQLQGTVDPAFLYNETFTHRTSESPSAMESNTAYANYVRKIANGRRFKRAVEIGCNDTFFLQKIMDFTDSATGIDPIWKNREHLFIEGVPEEYQDRIGVIGDFSENVDYDKQLGGKPDLIVSSFVFEHIREPLNVIRALFEVCDDDALFVLKVPGTDFLLDNCRFDQLSHQHYQQYTLDSFETMVKKAGGHVVDFHVYWPVWGAIMMAFKKGSAGGIETNFRRVTPNLVRERKERFDMQLDLLKRSIRDLGDHPVYGIGAAQNFPSLAHFIGDVSFMEGIIDDNPSRQNKWFPGIPVQTMPARDDIDYEDAIAMLTGPDYGRALIGRGRQLNFRQIVSPFNVI